MAAGPNQVIGAAPDGTLYTITLTGGGNAHLVVLDTDTLVPVTESVLVKQCKKSR